MKKSKLLKKVASIFMVALMVITMIPQSVYASEVSKVLDASDKKVVTYINDQGKEIKVNNGDTLNISTTENGTFTCDGYSSGSKDIEWRTSWEGSSQDKPIWIGLYSGDISIRRSGKVNAQVTKADTGEVLCAFNIVAEEKKVEDIKLYIDDKEVTNGTYTVAGHQWKEIKIKGKYADDDKYVDFSNTNGFSVTSDKDFISCNNNNIVSFAFNKPGTGVITLEGFGNKASVKVTSSYVPVESVKLNLRPEVKMHRLQYSMGSDDNYIGIGQSELSNGVTITPSNSSNYTVEWKGNNDKVASYHDTHSNGFIGHDSGTVTITASVDDNGRNISSSCDVEYVFEKPVEGISMKDDQNTLTIKEEDNMVLPLVFEPNGDQEEDQPSKTSMKWEFSKNGIVEIKHSRGQYDRYASKTFVMNALAQGTVEVTGTPLAAKDGVKPVKFTVTVEEGDTPPPNTDKLVSQGTSSCKSYYSRYWQHDTWKYTDEWDIIALKRSGIGLGKDEAGAIDSYKSSIASKIEDGTLSNKTKPTTLARVALALESIGVDASSFAGFNFYDALLNSNKINTGSNESIWALIALDAKKTPVSEKVKYDRDKLIETIISFQTKDGGFNLSSSENGGDVDLTAMAIQALSNYQNKSNAKEATEKALTFLRDSMESSCDMNGTSESIAQTIIAVSSLEKDIADKENGFTKGKSKNIFVAMDKYRDYRGFKHMKEDSDTNHMSTQQALLAFASYNRIKNNENTLYDMTDISSENYEVPVITVTGVENNQVVAKKNIKVQISASHKNENVENIKVWLNGEKIEGKDGNYTLSLKSGNNSMNIKAISNNGASSYLQWSIKFATLNYQKEINNKITKMNSWAKSIINENDYTFSENELIMTYMRTVGSSSKISNKVLEKLQEQIKFKNVDEWTNTIMVLHAMGVDVSNVYGEDFWKYGNSFITSLSQQDNVQILTAINSKSEQNVPKEISKENLLNKIATNSDGGFGINGKSNVYETGCAVIALAKEGNRQEEVEKAIEWLAENHTSSGGFTQLGSYSELSSTAKVMEALCEVGIDFTLDDRFNNTENIYTKLKILLAESGEDQNEDVYRALASYQRLYNGKGSIYSMDDVIAQPGLTTSRKKMEDTVVNYLQTIDFSTYSEEATEAAYLLIRGNEATKAVYNYLDVLKEAIKSNQVTTAREYFFAGLYLKENGVTLTDVDSTNMLSKLDDLEYTTTDNFGSVKSRATIPMSYALMTLNLEPNYETSLREDLTSKIESNRVPQSSWTGKGFYSYYNEYFAPVNQEATIVAMMALKSSEKLTDINSLIDYLGGKGTDGHDERQLDAGYWADYRKDSNKLVGNLVTTADMVVGIPMFEVDILSDARFNKDNGNVEDGIRAFYRASGFADTPYNNEVNTKSSIGGYRALLSLRFAENNAPSIYDINTKREIDKTTLESKIKEADTLKKDDYIIETWTVFEKALEEAKIIVKQEVVTQKEINLALESLRNAMNGLEEYNEINVTFRLMGDWKHDDKNEHTGYVNWIKTRSYTVSKDAKVYDIFEKAMKDSGLKNTVTDSNYVSMIQAPEVFGSYVLSQGDNGVNSAWQYMINGEYSKVGLNECKLSDGDVIVLRYVDDYTNELDMNEAWKKVEDLEPTEVFEKIRASAKMELKKYVDMEDYEKEQQKSIESILDKAMKQLDKVKDTVEVKEIVTEAKNDLDEIPTKAEIEEEAQKELLQIKEKAKEILSSYKNLSLYEDKEKAELNKILEKAFISIDEAKSKSEVEKIVTSTKAKMDDIETAEKIAIDRVIEAINKIENPVTIDQKPIIEAAREKYNALTKDQKKQVTNYEILVKAEEDLNKLVYDDSSNNGSEGNKPDGDDSNNNGSEDNKPDGDDSNNNEHNNSQDDDVKTGDNTQIGFIVCSLILAIGGIYLVELERRRGKIKSNK